MAQQSPQEVNTSVEHVPASEHGGGFPPFQKETFASQLLWLAVAFITLYLLMSRVAIPRIGGIFAARQKHVADHLAEAQGLKEQSDGAVAAYEKALGDARERAQKVAGEARDRLAAEAEASRKALEGKLGEQLSEAEKVILGSKQAAMTNVRAIATDAAASIVEKLVGTRPTASAVEAAVERSLKG
jgi:F-type H+-transporting ATPase subunit b